MRRFLIRRTIFGDWLTINSCGNPIYANKPVAACKSCGVERRLGLNPRIMGTLADETGSIAPGKLIWSDKAWVQLLLEQVGTGDKGFRRKTSDYHEASAVLTALDSGSLRDFEDRLIYSRVTLTFGWARVVGRLCILEVDW